VHLHTLAVFVPQCCPTLLLVPVIHIRDDYESTILPQGRVSKSLQHHDLLHQRFRLASYFDCSRGRQITRLVQAVEPCIFLALVIGFSGLVDALMHYKRGQEIVLRPALLQPRNHRSHGVQNLPLGTARLSSLASEAHSLLLTQESSTNMNLVRDVRTLHHPM
jgi:hypothetical protein